MENSALITADFIDILFDGRNKSYGAYELRKTYEQRIRIAIGSMILFCIVLVTGNLFAGKEARTLAGITVSDVVLEKIDEEKKPELLPPPPQQEQQVETSRFTPPRIVADQDLDEDEQIKEIEEMADTRIGTSNLEGNKDDEIIAAPIEKQVSNATAAVGLKDIETIFITVQQAARFPGDIDGWRKYLERNLNSEIPAENGATPGSYTVTVSFVVDKTGTISDVRAENDPGFGTRAEAIRVIQKGPAWIPAEQNGQKVNYRHKQNITFKVAEY
ncbi:MAG: hypothetical protein RLZZ28_642 [Bacteroidota bacterium]|jgi:protein TonB